MKRLVTAFILIVIVFSMTSLTASATTITENGTITPATLGGSVATNLAMFDSSLGILTGVDITLNLSATPYAEPFNFTSSPVTFTSSDWVSCSFPSAGNPNWTITYGSGSWTFTPVSGTTGQISGTGQTIGAFSGLILLGSTSVNEDWAESALPANLADYIGAGTLSFGVTGTATSAIYDQALFAGGGVNLAGTASVTYTYTPVPEPATMVLLGLGGLLFARKKK